MITEVTTPDASTRENSGEGTVSVHRFTSAKDNSDASRPSSASGSSGAASDLRKLFDASMKEDPTAARGAHWAKVQ
jgi:hypothetical protein